jgi:hypothetical protein
MKELVAAYERRYQRELHDIGVATALAQHDPKGLDKLAPPAPRNGGDQREKWW